MIRRWQRELGHLSLGQQMDLVAAARRRLRGRPAYWLHRALPATAAVAAMAGLSFLPSDRFGFAFRLIALAAITLAACVTAASLERRWQRRSLMAVLWERGIRPSACLVCGYDARGSDTPVCPECGTPLENPPGAAPSTSP